MYLIPFMDNKFLLNLSQWLDLSKLVDNLYELLILRYAIDFLKMYSVYTYYVV